MKNERENAEVLIGKLFLAVAMRNDPPILPSQKPPDGDFTKLPPDVVLDWRFRLSDVMTQEERDEVERLWDVAFPG